MNQTSLNIKEAEEKNDQEEIKKLKHKFLKLTEELSELNKQYEKIET